MYRDLFMTEEEELKARIEAVPVGTFHRTWLEKIVAENDPRFVKPRVDKALKAVQAVCFPAGLKSAVRF